MVQSFLVKILLMPVALLYGLLVGISNGMYTIGWLKSVNFSIPVISVGNLSVGGAGKTPHIEWLIEHLSPYIKVGVLSRGYRRKTKGYLQITTDMDARLSGDEPLQFKKKYPEILVSVCESRTFGIPQMVMDQPSLQLVLLDDAFQHRAVKPGLNILLTEFSLPFTQDFLLPVGRLREWKSGYRRADIIVVTKCPADPDQIDRSSWERELKPDNHQQVFFTFYEYGNPYYLFNGESRIVLDQSIDVFLVSAIARTDYLMSYLEEKVNSVRMLEFEDHHYFTNYEMAQIEKEFHSMESSQKVILTTEKDAMRLELHKNFIHSQQIPVFVLPVRVKFHEGGEEIFEEEVRRYLLNFKV
jgi:tetraacyldisaccharide 4'-kinase